VPVSTLRYYEDVGLIDTVPRDDSSGHRRYPTALVERIESLAHLRATGLSIEAMRTLMASGGHTPELIATKVELLAGHRRQVHQEIEALVARRDFLDNRIAYWTARLTGDEAGADQLQRQARPLHDRLG
jgi:DNA-binding transcriptional MerR regulator